MQNFTQAHKRELLQNPNVLKITKSHVVFIPSFKIKAVELYQNGESPEDIFRNHGINPQIFIPDFCRSCLRRWSEKIENEGKASVKSESRGLQATGRPAKIDIESLSVDDLKAIILIQEDLIEDLKKKKALVKKS